MAEDVMAEEQRWLLLIHAFDKQEKFMAARLVEVSIVSNKLDYLISMLSRIHAININREVEYNTVQAQKEVVNLLTTICPKFSNSPPYHTLRVMSLLPIIE